MNRTAIIVTALPVEYEAVRRRFRSTIEVTNEGSIYELASMEAMQGTWEIFLFQVGVGNPRAAQQIEKAVKYCHPAIVLFVGIAGGIKHVQIGDIVVASKIYSYAASNESTEGLLPRQTTHITANDLEQSARAEAKRWNESSISSRVFVEPIASGGALLAWLESNPAENKWRFTGDAIAVEMEGWGFMDAALIDATPGCVIRGISNLVNDKSGGDETYGIQEASDAAAKFAFELIQRLKIKGLEPVAEIPSIRVSRSEISSDIFWGAEPLNLNFLKYGAKLGGSLLILDDQPSIVTVHFATDRNLETNKLGVIIPGSSRGNSLIYGKADVSIPSHRRHRVGRIERPSIWRLEFNEDPHNHLVIRSIEYLLEDTALSQIGDAAGSDDTDSALIFIHGYNNSFERALYRTAQITHDISFGGAAVLYSWPSLGTPIGYNADEESINWSVPHFTDFLHKLKRSTGIGKYYLIAHSMGNRLVTRTFRDMAHMGCTSKVKEYISAAPDIDLGEFSELASLVRNCTDRVTVYAASNDRALQASARIHGFPRLGARPHCIDDMDVIDASGLSTDVLGHGYFGSTRTALTDIHYLIKTGYPPLGRFGLRPVTTRRGTYYKFVP